MNTLLFKGCQDGDVNKVREALLCGADPNVRDAEDWMPLHYAAENGFEEIILILLESGADVNALNSAGFTPFQILMICEHYSPRIVEAMVLEGAATGSPLHRAILLNDKAETENLIKQGDYLNSTDGLGNTPLHVSVAIDNPEVTAALLKAGAIIDAPDVYETTPLLEACSLGQLHTVELLLSYGANPEQRDYNGRTALTFAAGNARREITELLLKRGVELDAVDLFGNTALHYAYENEEFEIAGELLKHGANDSLLNEDGKRAVQMVPDYE